MAAWSWSVGTGPEKVTALELVERGSTVHLRWRANGNWKKQSTTECCRTASGRLIEAVCERAKQAARDKHEELKRQAVAPAPAGEALTIGATEDLLFDPQRGRYRRNTAHGKDVLRALAAATGHWGEATPWAAITRADWRSLWRAQLAALRAKGHHGYRGAELTIQLVATIASWLVEEEIVPAIRRPQRDWRTSLATDYREEAEDDYRPHRPRHTLEEMRRLLTAARAGDPRFALLLALGAELRLGQVVRCRRSDLDLEAGTLVIRGRGKKGGTRVQLTPGQLAAVREALDGYLGLLSASLADFPLFPQGQLPGGRKGRPRAAPERHGQAKPVGRRWILSQFVKSEQRAGVPHVDGRGAYGLKRVAVDAVLELGISREALKVHGGWSDTQVPDTIYATQEQAFARAEAARLRAQLRGEVDTANGSGAPITGPVAPETAT